MRKTTFNKGNVNHVIERKKYAGLCFDCGQEVYPVSERKHEIGAITTSTGTCPRCKKENVSIIPIKDFEFQVGGKLEDFD